MWIEIYKVFHKLCEFKIKPLIFNKKSMWKTILSKKLYNFQKMFDNLEEYII